MADRELPTLPCFPCPHNAACCAYGSTVTEVEAHAIEAKYGPGKVYRSRWGEWRTRIRNGRCIFFVDGGCEIHAEPFYPAVCRGFPWRDAEHGGPYEFDRTICPEFLVRPELQLVFPFRPAAKPTTGPANPVA
ncbi:MAG: YkgJ family cysteine cluster protein [Gemmatimonadales bacterium]